MKISSCRYVRSNCLGIHGCCDAIGFKCFIGKWLIIIFLLATCICCNSDMVFFLMGCLFLIIFHVIRRVFKIDTKIFYCLTFLFILTKYIVFFNYANHLWTFCIQSGSYQKKFSVKFEKKLSLVVIF